MLEIGNFGVEQKRESILKLARVRNQGQVRVKGPWCGLG